MKQIKYNEFLANMYESSNSSKNFHGEMSMFLLLDLQLRLLESINSQKELILFLPQQILKTFFDKALDYDDYEGDIFDDH